VPHIFANETRWHLFCFAQRVRDAGLESGDLFKPRSLSGFRCAKMAAILPFWISRDMAVTGWPVDIEEDARSAVEGGEAGLVFLDACFAVAGDVDEETGDPVRQHLEHGAGLAAAIGVQSGGVTVQFHQGLQFPGAAGVEEALQQFLSVDVLFIVPVKTIQIHRV
jgi:hypothetical protein